MESASVEKGGHAGSEGRLTEAAFNALCRLPSFREQHRKRVLVLVVVEVLPDELVDDEILVRHWRLRVILQRKCVALVVRAAAALKCRERNGASECEEGMSK